MSFSMARACRIVMRVKYSLDDTRLLVVLVDIGADVEEPERKSER
jgi:hypothetical protein